MLDDGYGAPDIDNRQRSYVAASGGRYDDGHVDFMMLLIVFTLRRHAARRYAAMLPRADTFRHRRQSACRWLLRRWHAPPPSRRLCRCLLYAAR